ncbi:cellulose binding domain-containing protein [Catellatospora tritici]|uniref:cellulose binding domain-containing protein n=1 Tax=Catellatospora tritici TaxID=2851566 RepID=UPI001C2D7D1D|nr:cellulose binding domain-containing protein [Catellatospora tritici]MBV1854230.1 cellulose binding domain-containing protein [Catellatospora tritici]
MTTRPLSLSRRAGELRLRAAVLAALSALALALLMLPRLPAAALTVTTPVTGNTTWFDALGAPYGGCGMPQANLDSQDFIALNVFNTPNDYAYSTRPVPAGTKVGAWDNGRNCGRWVQVTVGDYCTGINDGAPGQAFCRNGSYVADGYNGGVLNMLVADSCGDANAWCRDDPYHIDLAKASLNRFVKNGATVTDMYPNHFNNRHMTWQFISAPNYSGDIKVGFLQGAQSWWGAIAVSHLANGIHGVEYFANGAWQTANMNSDMGQSYLTAPVTAGGTQFQIRVRDANDALINNGRVYTFSLPASCGSSCPAAYTEVAYTTSGGPSGSPSASASASASPRPSTSPSASPSPSPSASPSPSPSQSPSPSPSGQGGACTATLSLSSQWQGGWQGQVTVTAGAAAISAWTVKFTTPSGASITQLWNGVLTVSGSNVTVKNQTYNGSLTARASTTFGFTATGSPFNVPLTCTSP